MSDRLSRIWSAFDSGQILTACAWCGRVRIDDVWVAPPPAALAAVDERYAFSHSICDRCAGQLSDMSPERPVATDHVTYETNREATA